MSAAIIPFPAPPQRYWLAQPVPNGGMAWKACVMGLRTDDAPLAVAGLRGTITRHIWDASREHLGLPIIFATEEVDRGGWAA